MARLLALLRGINVGGHKRIAMTDLREVALGCGFADVATYIQSGNLVFSAPKNVRAPALLLEKAIEERFGFAVDVIVRTAAEWTTIHAGNPLLAVARREPKLVYLLVSKAPPRREALRLLRERASAGERIEVAGDAIWIHYPEGAGRTRLAPGWIDEVVGSPVTARNWTTVQALHAMLTSEG
ncbi:MAG TPA: DUF1697 domain-containing protein [Planctomycetota bacterium]|nr:DUF1697 domain-containing protein [Planctomycetota bacterium]